MKIKGKNRRIFDGKSICGTPVKMCTAEQVEILKEKKPDNALLREFCQETEWEGATSFHPSRTNDFSCDNGVIIITPWPGNHVPEPFGWALSMKEADILIKKTILSLQKIKTKSSFFCPCCECERQGETGTEYKGELLCVSCVEGFQEE